MIFNTATEKKSSCWINTWRDKMSQPQKCTFEKNPGLHDYLPQFCSENMNWLSYKHGYMPVLKTRNVNNDGC